MTKATSKKRARKAYRLANRILWSYLWLFTRKKLFGQAYYDKRVIALHEKNASAIKETILELKGLFTKVGQLLSVMSTILPDAYASSFSTTETDHA